MTRRHSTWERSESGFWFVGTREFSYYFVSTRKTALIKEMLKNYKGILIVDGYHTSKLLDPERVQRCTAHMDRDFKRWAKKEEMLTPHLRRVRNFCAAGRTIIHEAREAKKAGLGPEKYEEMCKRTHALIKYYKRYPEMAGIVNKVSNAMPSLFTFMNYSFVDSTNNLAERGMREVVKHRAVKSLLRTMEGAGVFAVLLTILMTNPGKDLLKLLKKIPRPSRKKGRRVIQFGVRLATARRCKPGPRHMPRAVSGRRMPLRVKTAGHTRMRPRLGMIFRF